MDIEFVLDEKVEEFPIHKTVQASKSKWAHFARLGSEEEVDTQMAAWLSKACEISKQQRLAALTGISPKKLVKD